MNSSKKVLIGVAWPYVNGDLHLGHLAGYLLPADIFSRYMRLRGHDVLMVSGSDTHGTPITVEADKRGITPVEVMNIYHPKDLALFKQYNLSFDLYTSTHTDIHKRVAQEMFLDLLKNDYIVKDVMKQYYSPTDDQFLPDRYVEGTCPYCGAKHQRSDQCEVCGRWIGDGELIEPTSKLSGAKVELRDTEHYFIDFEKFQPELEKYVESKKDIWRKWVWNESNGWLKEGLKKRAITRDMDWAIDLPVEEIKKLPAEKQLKEFKGKKMYVWFEAVIGYLSAPQEWATLKKENEAIIFHKDKGQSEKWEDWWKNPDSEIYNFMGQDNLVFHTLMWPAQLMGAKREYSLPHNVVVNKFMNYEGQKFSKSRNWTIDSKAMADKFGVDPVRFYIASNLPENKEANFTWEGFVDSINNELVANLGNLINRTYKFIEAKFAGELSDKSFKLDDDIQAAIDGALNQTVVALDRVELVEALSQIMQLSRVGNQYFDKEKVWEVIKTDEQKARDILLNLVNLINALGLMLTPYLPDSMKQLSDMVSREAVVPKVGSDLWKFDVVNQFKLTKPVEILFAKLEREQVLETKEN